MMVSVQGWPAKVLLKIIGTVLTVFLLFACGSQDTGQPQKGERGTVRISGAWALYPMMVRWAEEYQKANPGIKIDVSAGGAGKGIADALTGMVDIGMVSRDIKKEETAKGAVYVAVVKDAVFPTMNEKNPAAGAIAERGIGREPFVDLWIREKPVTWSQLSGQPGQGKVMVYTRSDACGAAETWALYLGGRQEDLKGVGVYGDPGLSEAVRKDVNGLGYNNLNFAYDAKTGKALQGLRIIPVDVNGNGRVDPAEDLGTKDKAVQAVKTGTYPSPPARDLFLVAKDSFKEPVAAFVRWILTEGQKYVGEVGYIQVTDAQIREGLGKVKP
jgi:phosphate transport system substrate-binding protein